MKRLWLFAILACFAASCSKDSNDDADGDGYYMKFTLDGAEQTFSQMAFATFSVADDIHLGSFGAFKDDGATAENMLSVLVGSLEVIEEGVTYTGLLHPPVTGGSTPEVFFSYIDGERKTFANRYDDHAVNTVTISELRANHVKGTFSGKVYDVSDAGATARSLSGSFFVRRHN